MRSDNRSREVEVDEEEAQDKNEEKAERSGKKNNLKRKRIKNHYLCDVCNLWLQSSGSFLRHARAEAGFFLWSLVFSL